MTKWILFFSVLLQMLITPSIGKTTVSNADFNSMIDAVTHEQLDTAHTLWNSERVKDYIRRKRTLQNTRTMIADKN